MFKALIDRICL